MCILSNSLSQACFPFRVSAQTEQSRWDPPASRGSPVSTWTVSSKKSDPSIEKCVLVIAKKPCNINNYWKKAHVCYWGERSESTDCDTSVGFPFILAAPQVKAATGQESSRARLSPTRSIRSWVTPPATPPPYTPLIQTAASASSTPGLVHRGFWNSQQGSDWPARSTSLLKVPPRLSGHHLQQRSSAHSLVEAVSDHTPHSVRHVKCVVLTRCLLL